MVGKDRYSLLSKAVRIANTANSPYLHRLKTLAKFISSIFSCQSVSIYLCDETHRFLVSCISTSAHSSSVSCRIPLGEGIAGYCAAVYDILCMPPEKLHPEEIHKGNETEFRAFPIGDAKTSYGVVVLGSKDANRLEDDQLALLKDIFVVIDGIIQRIGISEDSNRKITNLTILNELGGLLNRAASPESLVPIILDTCHVQSGSSCTMLRLEGGVGDTSPLRQYRVRHSARRNLATMTGIEDLCSAKVRYSGIPLLICDLISDDELPPSYICVPLRFEKRILGTMTFFGKEEGSGFFRNYTEEDRELFESMANLISNAIAGAVNFQHAVRLSRENDHKIKELALLYRLSNTMLSTIRLNKLMHLILSALTGGANPLFERAMLFLINERSGVMQGMLGAVHEFSMAPGQPYSEPDSDLASRWDISEQEMMRQQQSEFSQMVKSSRLELNKTKELTSKAVLERRLIYVQDTTHEKRIDREFVKRFKITSFAAMPLLAKEQVVGIVLVDNPFGGKPISRDDLRFLELFTSQAGMAIENSLLYNRIEDTNRRLRDAQERLLHGERLATIGEMAAGIAHELKSPLVSIGGFARRLEKKLKKDSDEGGYVATIVTEVNRLEKMLTDILSFSRKSTLCYSLCSIQEIIDEALSVVASNLDENRITVIKQVPKKVITFLGDSQQMKQVFINLFINAQEAMQGPGELKITVNTCKHVGRDGIAVKVADTGGGIALSSLCNIFNPFFTTKVSGTGLGLPIANRIVTNHCGNLQVNNHPGVGVEFTVVIPVEPPPPNHKE